MGKKKSSLEEKQTSKNKTLKNKNPKPEQKKDRPKKDIEDQYQQYVSITMLHAPFLSLF
jgi:broad specificity polyphosphatase/5'/3'-nucleotidase SurE